MHTLSVVCFVMLIVMYTEAHDTGCKDYHISAVLDHPVRSKIAAVYFLVCCTSLGYAEVNRNLPWVHARVSMFFGLGVASILTALVTEKRFPTLHICFASLTFAIMMAVCVTWCLAMSCKGFYHHALIFATMVYILHGIMLAHEMYHERMTGVGMYEIICLALGFYIICMVNAIMIYQDIFYKKPSMLLLTNG